MFNTRNILIATGAIVAIALVIWFISRAKRKNEEVVITIKTPEDNDDQKETPESKMQPEAEKLDLNTINFAKPLVEPNDNFPLGIGSKGERVRRFQNYLYKEHAKYQQDSRLDFGEEQGVWGPYTEYFAQKYGIKSLPESTYNSLRIATYNHKMSV